MKIFFLGVISLFVFSQMVSAQKNFVKGFALYLLPARINTNQLKTIDLKKLKPVGKPVITESDIRYYQKDNHQFRIDYPAADRIKKINNQGGTKSFAVFVDGEAVYTGAFWKSILSQSFDGIIIDTYKSVGDPPYYSNTDYPVLTLESGYPSAEYFKGADLRSDPRIFKALETAGKLYDEVELVVKCRKIRSSGKRRASSYFTFEVLAATKGEFKEKIIELELFDGKLLPELDAEMGWSAGGNVDFNPSIEIVLTISQQVGRDKPDWFLREYRKK